METPGEAAIPVLIRSLNDPDQYIRREAAISLGEIGPAAKAAVPALTSLWNDPSPDVRSFAVRSLGKMGPAAKEAIPTLEKCLEHEWDYPTSLEFREALSRTLRKIR
jgi:HEAT repeat protein